MAEKEKKEKKKETLVRVDGKRSSSKVIQRENSNASSIAQ